MNKEIARGLIAGGLALSSCSGWEKPSPSPLVAPDLPPVTFTPTLESIPTETPFPDTGGYFSEGLICPAEPILFDLPEVGDVVELQNLTWKIVAVAEVDGETCEGGLRVVIEFCPCVEETPTPTTTKIRVSPTPTRTPTQRRETNTPRPPTETPKPPTKTPTSPPTETEVPTATDVPPQTPIPTPTY